MPPGPRGGVGYDKSHQGEPNATAWGRWYEDVGKVKRPRPVRTGCCDSVRPDVSNLTNLSLVIGGAGLVNIGPLIYA
jgi:hypothetical protein